MSFYLSYSKDIKQRNAPHIFYYKGAVLYMLFNKVETQLFNINKNKDNPIIEVLNYIKSNHVHEIEILIPSFSEKYLDEACDSISKYLLDNDDSIGLITKNQNFRKDYLWLLDKYGITYSVPYVKPIKATPRVLEKPQRKVFDVEGSFRLSTAPRLELESNMVSGLVLDEPFNTKFIKLLNESGKSNSDVYTKGGITRQVFSNILSKKNFIPRKDTIICLIIGMELNYIDATNLLASAGYTLSNSIVSDVVVMKYLKRGEYDLDAINSELDERGCSLLGWKPRDN